MDLERTLAKTESAMCTACEKTEPHKNQSKPMTVAVLSRMNNGTKVYHVKFFHTDCLKTVKTALRNCGVEFFSEKEWR